MVPLSQTPNAEIDVKETENVARRHHDGDRVGGAVMLKVVVPWNMGSERFQDVRAEKACVHGLQVSPARD